jgi:hypothetical protein
MIRELFYFGVLRDSCCWDRESGWGNIVVNQHHPILVCPLSKLNPQASWSIVEDFVPKMRMSFPWLGTGVRTQKSIFLAQVVYGMDEFSVWSRRYIYPPQLLSNLNFDLNLMCLAHSVHNFGSCINETSFGCFSFPVTSLKFPTTNADPWRSTDSNRHISSQTVGSEDSCDLM